MIPPAQPVHGFWVIDEACRSHGFPERKIIACNDVEIGRHECAVRMDRGSRPANQHRHTAGCTFISGKSIGQWDKGRKICRWK